MKVIPTRRAAQLRLAAAVLLAAVIWVSQSFASNWEWRVRVNLWLRGCGDVTRVSVLAHPDVVREQPTDVESLWRNGTYVGSVDSMGDVVLASDRSRSGLPDSLPHVLVAILAEVASFVLLLLVGIFSLPNVVLWGGRRRQVGFPVVVGQDQ